MLQNTFVQNKCEFINNCRIKRTPNKCDLCENGYAFSPVLDSSGNETDMYNQQECIPVDQEYCLVA